MLLDICKITSWSTTYYLILEKTVCMIINTPHIKLKNTPTASLNGYFLEYVTL